MPSWEHEDTNHYEEDEVLSEWQVLFGSDWHALTTSPGLISNLKAVSAPMYCLYLAMKERSPDQITLEEIAVASGNKVLDPGAVSEFLRKVESSNVTIRSAFEKQVESAAVSCLFF